MASFEPASWSAWIWFLYAFAAAYLAGFIGFYVRFERAERRAMAGGADEVEAFNRMLSGFPNAFYAKMLGKRALEASGSRDGAASGR